MKQTVFVAAVLALSAQGASAQSNLSKMTLHGVKVQVRTHVLKINGDRPCSPGERNDLDARAKHIAIGHVTPDKLRVIQKNGHDLYRRDAFLKLDFKIVCFAHGPMAVGFPIKGKPRILHTRRNGVWEVSRSE